MTKHVRIENADTSNHIVKVLVQDKVFDADGSKWETIRTILLDYPTAMTEQTIFGTRRLIIEELA